VDQGLSDLYSLGTRIAMKSKMNPSNNIGKPQRTVKRKFPARIVGVSVVGLGSLVYGILFHALLMHTNSDTTTSLQQPDATDDATSTSNIVNNKNDDFVWNYPSDQDLSALQQCFPANSKNWLQGPRHGNNPLQDDLMDDDFVTNMILFGSHLSTKQGGSSSSSSSSSTTFSTETILQQSMCHPDSRFLNATDPLTDDRSMQLWIVRLTFMSMHRIQHQFAVPEVIPSRTTLSTECQRLTNTYQIGKYDYECPAGRFLLVPIENLGLGAVMRTTVLSGLLAAMATNRTVLFINHAPVGPKPIRQAWYHASCDRMDVQCFFHPPSPCVLTHAQLEQAPVMNQFRNVTKLFKNPLNMMEEPFFKNEPVIVLPLKTVTRSISKSIPMRLQEFTVRVRGSLNETDPRRTVLQKVAERFVSNVHRDKVNQLISYGLVLYAMRPHIQSQNELRDIMQQIVPPSSTKAIPAVTLGLPIRGTIRMSVRQLIVFDSMTDFCFISFHFILISLGQMHRRE